MQTLTFKEFNALVQPTEYFINGDNLLLYAHFLRIQVEGVFCNDELKSITFVDHINGKYYHWGDGQHKGELYTSTTVSNIVKKIEAVKAGEPYSTDVEVEVDLEDHEWLRLMMEAHKKDITLNQYVQEVIHDVFHELKEVPPKDR